MKLPKVNLTYMLLLGTIITLVMVPLAFADVYINVMAINGSATQKDTTVKFNLPGDLSAEDILDTDGLQLEYNPNYANFFVHGKVSLESKATKTFKIRVRDVWRITPEQMESLKKEIDEGYERLGKVHDQANADLLKAKLKAKIDYIYTAQTTSADSIEKRIDSYRAYRKEIKRIENDALSVDYWRSDPGKVDDPKIIRLIVSVENPTKTVQKGVKEKEYLPTEVKPEHVVEAEGFEVRYDQKKQLAFLYKEEDLEPGEKKRYSIGILDTWMIAQKDMDYLNSRTDYAFDFLKGSRFEDSAKFLVDRIKADLEDIKKSQVTALPILEHIGRFRSNSKTFGSAKDDVEQLEKILAVYREDLEKSKVKNVLSRVKSLKSIGDVSNAVFKKPLEQNNAWKYIGWVVLFAGLITLVNFGMWMMRSKDKKVTNGDSK